MNIKINNKEFKQYENLVVNLRYNQVASTFSFAVYLDPIRTDLWSLFRPGAYPKVVIEHNGEVLLTGTLWPTSGNDSPMPELTTVSGYSTSGILEDTGIHPDSFPVQYDGLTLKEITQKLITPFGVSLVVDATVAAEVEKAYDTTTASVSGTVKSYLAELCAQRNIIMTHDEQGRLVYTKASAKQLPVTYFEGGPPVTKITPSFSGQSIHSSIVVRKQADSDGGNAGKSVIQNPYGTGRVCIRNVQQTSGKDTDTQSAARNILSEELLAIKYTIDMDRWEINDKVARPGMIVSVMAPNAWLYQKTNLFIDGVDLTGDSEKETAVLTCVLPEVYNGQTPKNIFA